MANLRILILLYNLVIIQGYVNAYSVDSVAILPLEVRPRYSPRYLPNVNPPPMERLDAALRPTPQEAMLRRNTDPPPRTEVRESYERSAEDNSTNLLNDFLRAIGVDDSDNQEARDNSRPYVREYQYSPFPQQQTYGGASSTVPYHQQQPQIYPQTYPVQRPNYSPVPPTINYGSSAYLQPAHVPTYKTLDLIKPFASKVSTKIGGLLSIVLALLGGGGASGLSGFKDILVNGIIKPLFSLKGGLKELISKLSIPVISLLLINVEMLLTIWWLWDDCPQVQATHEAVYSAPAAATSYQYPKSPVFSYNSNY